MSRLLVTLAVVVGTKDEQSPACSRVWSDWVGIKNVIYGTKQTEV